MRASVRMCVSACVCVFCACVHVCVCVCVCSCVWAKVASYLGEGRLILGRKSPRTSCMGEGRLFTLARLASYLGESRLVYYHVLNKRAASVFITPHQQRNPLAYVIQKKPHLNAAAIVRTESLEQQPLCAKAATCF